MNTINLIGNICQEPELKQTTVGKPVVTVNLAVKRPFSKDTTDFIPLVLWDKNAEYIHNYARKGSKIAVSGKLTTREYTDKQGTSRKVFEVVADTVEIINSGAAPADVPTQGNKPHVEPKFEELSTDYNLPF
jgi:single-strand DNA-binding protein